MKHLCGCFFLLFVLLVSFLADADFFAYSSHHLS